MYKRVTRFTAQISALVTGAQKDRIEALSYGDEVATAEVIRGALELGLARLEELGREERFALYLAVHAGGDTSSY